MQFVTEYEWERYDDDEEPDYDDEQDNPRETQAMYDESWRYDD